MSIKGVTLDPELADLISAAFDKSWQFVKTDPELAHVDMDRKRAQLERHLTHLARSGERDLWRLANRAIGGLRRETTQPNSLSGRRDQFGYSPSDIRSPRLAARRASHEITQCQLSPAPIVEERLTALHLVNKRRLFASRVASFRSSA